MARGETNSYTSNSFDELYTRKLNEFCARIRALIFDTVFVASVARSCHCGCRIMIWIGGYKADRCIRCYKVKSRDAEQFDMLLREYPDQQECYQEWSPPKREPSKTLTTETVAFGARIEEARIALGWSKEQLAAKIFKKNGENISVSTINMVEHGHQNCSPHVREQLERILGLNERIAV